jgi:hypothetical protein
LGLLLAVVLNFGRANRSSAPSSDFDFFQLESVTPTPKNVEGSETCSSTTALNVIESTMDYATVSRYNKAYNDGRDLPEKKNPHLSNFPTVGMNRYCNRNICTVDLR